MYLFFSLHIGDFFRLNTITDFDAFFLCLPTFFLRVGLSFTIFTNLFWSIFDMWSFPSRRFSFSKMLYRSTHNTLMLYSVLSCFTYSSRLSLEVAFLFWKFPIKVFLRMYLPRSYKFFI